MKYAFVISHTIPAVMENPVIQEVFILDLFHEEKENLVSEIRRKFMKHGRRNDEHYTIDCIPVNEGDVVTLFATVKDFVREED